MKRDWDLIRKILFAVEEHDHGRMDDLPMIEGYTREQTAYHCYLICDAGLAEGIDTSHMGSKSPEWEITQLNAAGHDFIEGARNDTVWNKARTTAKEKSLALTVDALKALLIQASVWAAKNAM